MRVFALAPRALAAQSHDALCGVGARADSYFKNTGRQLALVERFIFKNKHTPEQMEEKKQSLTIISTAHNFSEILAALLFLFILLAEGVANGLGLHKEESHGDLMSGYFKDSGMMGGWRGEVGPLETGCVLLMVLISRVLMTLVEEYVSADKYKPRRHIVTTYLELLCFKGPLKYRMLCYFFVACACVVAPSELGFFGKDMHALRLAEDDEHTRF